MTVSHDELIDVLSVKILHTFKDFFGEVFISNVSMDFPKPDFIYIPFNMKRIKEDEIEKVLQQKTLLGSNLPLPVSFEVKTPFVYKHEYLTGIGQAITYNTIFPLSYLVIPTTNIEDFEVEQFIKNVVEFNKLKCGVFSYKIKDFPELEINLVKKAEPVTTTPKKVKESVKGIRRSYSYWRETQPNEVYEALRISRELEKKHGGDILEELLNRLWDEILSKRFSSAKNIQSFLLNYKLFLIQNALLDSKGRLTMVGKHTLQLGDKFGPESAKFSEVVTYVLLKYGGHYTLLSKIYNFQMEKNGELKNWECWKKQIEDYFKSRNYFISTDDFRIDLPRLPYGYEKYFCSIVKNGFVDGWGILIDYPKIVKILDLGRKIYSIIEVED